MSLKRIFLLLRDENTKVVQTHISVVFIKGDVVYKVKKPVNFGFLDFSSLEKRKYYCEREVELNRRLCPELYLGVEPLVWNEEIIDYAVVMRRLPEERVLKRLVREGKVQAEDMERVALKIAQFHKEAKTGPEIAAFGRVENFRRNTDENFEQTAPFVGKTIDEETYRFVKEKTDEFYRRHGRLLNERAERGFVRDCHGDLHTEHIVLTDDICIFDCIEFNDRFRYIDVACDLAFLLMDLDFLGKGDLSQVVFESYLRATGDEEARVLMPLFKSYRAYVRGKVNSFMSEDKNLSPADRELRAKEARSYFELARRYLEEA